MKQGPIIIQEAFKVLPEDTLETIKSKGRLAESAALLEAVKLFLSNKLEVYWGRVNFK
jgi:formyltetrahydrofolate deformylase